MKRITKKLITCFLAVACLLAVLPLRAAYAAEGAMSVTLRIEGVEKNLYYETVEIPYTDSLTLQDALSYIDSEEDSITITGIDSAYITDINGETAGSFGGWDGWLYKVNGVEASVGIDGMLLSEGDDIVLYYGDPYGIGMQYPTADTTDIEEGIIRFTSSDTTYDADFNPTVTVNPVAGASVTLSNEETSAEFVTDADGKIEIAPDQLADGTYTVRIEKTSDTGLPLVLRFAPDAAIVLDTELSAAPEQAAAADEAVKEAEAQAPSDTVSGVPKTGESAAGSIYLIIAAAAFLCVSRLVKKPTYEK